MNHYKDFLGVIPARGGSKGVKKKNLREVGGISLLERTINLAYACHFGDWFVSSDDYEIRAASPAHHFLHRPQALALDSTPMSAVLQSLTEKMHLRINDSAWDWIVLLQPTSPFRELADVWTCMNIALATGRSVTSVVEVGEHHPSRMYKRDHSLRGFLYVREGHQSNRQDLSRLYLRNGAVYVLSREDVESGNVPPLEPLLYPMPPERSFNIDTEFDLELADAWARRCLGDGQSTDPEPERLSAIRGGVESP